MCSITLRAPSSPFHTPYLANSFIAFGQAWTQHAQEHRDPGHLDPDAVSTRGPSYELTFVSFKNQTEAPQRAVAAATSAPPCPPRCLGRVINEVLSLGVPESGNARFRLNPSRGCREWSYCPGPLPVHFHFEGRSCTRAHRISLLAIRG